MSSHIYRQKAAHSTEASPAATPAVADAPARGTIRREDRGGRGSPPADPQGAFDDGTDGGGERLPFKEEMEAAFGEDFSGVQVHLGQGGPMADLGASAAAQGETVVFADANPSKETVAHELTHVVQARGSGGEGVQADTGLSSPGDSAEVEARSVASRVAGGQPSGAVSAPASGILREDPVCLPEIELLRDAVSAGDATAAINHFYALSPQEQTELCLDGRLLGNFLALVTDPDARHALAHLQPPAALWLEMAGAHIASGEELANVLADVGITGSGALSQAASLLLPFPAFCSPQVLATLVADGDPAGQAACLEDAACVELLRMTWPSIDPFSVLPDLLAEQVLAIFLAGGPGREWLFATPTALNDHILLSGTAQEWVRGLVGTALADLEYLVQLDPVSWGSWLAGTAVLAELLIVGTPEAEVMLYALAAYDPLTAVAELRAVGWLPVEMLAAAIDGVWLDLQVMDDILHNGASPDDQFLIASDGLLTAELQALGVHPLDVFDLLAADDLKLPEAMAVNPDLTLWMLVDPGRLQAYLVGIADRSLWTEWLVANDVPSLIQLAALDETWRDGVDAGNHLTAVLTAAPAATDETTFDGLYNLVGDATARTRPQNDLAYTKIIQVPRMTAGQMPDVLYSHKDAEAATVGGVAMTWDIVKTPVPVDPSDSALGLFLNAMRQTPRSMIMATNTLIFAAEEEFYWSQLTPVVSPAWYAFSTNQRRAIPTSYAGSGVVTIAAHKAGDTVDETVRAADGTVTETGATLNMNAGDVDPTHIGADDTQGVGYSTGGGVDNSATGGDDNETIPGGLTYFQNHAVHEFGHSVGETVYNKDGGGTLPKGDTFAQTYGGWAQAGTAVDYARSMSWTTAMDTTNYTLIDGGKNLTVAGTVIRDFLTSIAEKGLSNATDPAALVDAADPAKYAATADLMTALGAHGVLSGTTLFKTVDRWGSAMPDEGYILEHGVAAVAKITFYSTRWGDRWVQYDKQAHDNCKSSLGWYSLSSPMEMFAEAFTANYSGGTVPVARGANSWTTYFSDLEKSPSVATAAGAAPGVLATPYGAPAAGSGETEPAVGLI